MLATNYVLFRDFLFLADSAENAEMLVLRDLIFLADSAENAESMMIKRVLLRKKSFKFIQIFQIDKWYLFYL